MKQIGGEPDYAREMVGRLANGDLTMDVHVDAKDNSSLLFAMKNMTGKLSSVVTDVNSGAQALGQRVGRGERHRASPVSKPPASKPPEWKKPVPPLSR
jgi:methyl-accepting chemotaxis protein